MAKVKVLAFELELGLDSGLGLGSDSKYDVTGTHFVISPSFKPCSP